MKRRPFVSLSALTLGLTFLPKAVLSKEQLAASMRRPKRCGGLDYPRITKERVLDLYADIERWGDEVCGLWFNPKDAVHLKPVFGVEHFDQECNWPILEMGIVGHLWGVLVFADPSIPIGYIGTAGSSDGDFDEKRPPRLRSLHPDCESEIREFYGAHKGSSFDIRVRGAHHVERSPEGGEAHVYEFRGRKGPFIRSSTHRLTDQQVVDQLLVQLMERAKLQGIASDKTDPVWLLRTSVKDYRVVQRDPVLACMIQTHHTDADVHALIEAGRLGPVV